MKQDNNTLIFILKVTVIVLATASCSPMAFKGEISHASGDTACIPKQCFKVFKSVPMPSQGDKVVFTRTSKRKLINCKRIK